MNKSKENEYSLYFNSENIKKDIKANVIKGGIITSSSQLILYFISLTSTMVLARLLLPEHFGLIGMVTALTILIERFQDIGLGDAVVQKEKIYHNEVGNLFWINISISSIFAIIIALSSKFIAIFYNDNRLIMITIALSFNFICSGLAIQHQALIRRRMHAKYYILIKIFSVGAGFAIAVIMAICGFGYWALVCKELARSAISCILAWLLCPWRPGWYNRNTKIKQLIKFGGNIAAYNLIFTFTNNLDSILIGKFCGIAQVGIYTRAKQLTAIPLTQLLQPMQYVSLPALSAYQNDFNSYRRYYTKMLSIISFLYMPLIIYLGIFSNQIVYLTLGGKWMAAVPYFRILAVSMFAAPIMQMFGLLMLSSGQTKRYLKWGVITNLSVIFSLLFGIKWGTLGVAIAWPIAMAINFAISMFYVFRGTAISGKNIINCIYRPAIASIIMGMILYLLLGKISLLEICYQILFSSLLGLACYLMIWLFFKNGKNMVYEYIAYPLYLLKRKY